MISSTATAKFAGKTVALRAAIRAPIAIVGHQPCCSKFFTIATNAQQQEQRKMLGAVKELRFFSSGSGKPDKSHERPHMYQLEHVQKRLEFTVSLMFQLQPDYTFFSKDVVLEDQIFQTIKQGLPQVMNHMTLISLLAKLRAPSIEAEALTITPILEDGTVRLRWRLHYITWLQMLNPKMYKQEYKRKNEKWFDGYSIFHVDGEGLVFKWTLQKTQPEDSALSSQLKDKTKEFVKRVVMPNTANCNNGRVHFERQKPEEKREEEKFVPQQENMPKLRQMRG